jgi:hypothetical protein
LVGTSPPQKPGQLQLRNSLECRRTTMHS